MTTAATPPVDPGGPQWQLSAHGYDAIVTAVGASVRVLRHHGRDLVVPFDADRVRPLYRGAMIAPWPNRVADGRYAVDGVEHQLPLNEVDRGHALHGLVHWVRWATVEATPRRLVLAHDLVPQDGYPFALRLRAAFEVGPDGLTTRLTATNPGPVAAPYGCCPHPYLVAGPGRVDDWRLTLPADTRLEVDARLVPTHRAPVAQVGCDFRAGALIGGRTVDHAFTGLSRGPDGRVVVRLLDAAGAGGVAMSWGDWGGWVQVHTADRPEAWADRVGLAVEPMSCPPDAFNAEGGPPMLAPGATHEAQWTITAVGERS